MKAFVALILSILLLAGCSAPINTKLLPINGVMATSITLVLPKDSDKVTKDSAQFFTDTVKDLSKGSLIVSVQEDDNPLKQLENNLVLVPLESLSAADQRLDMLNQPFFFDSVRHISMSLNSPRNLQMLEKLVPHCGKAFGALYKGSINLLTSRKFYDELGIETHKVSVPNFKCVEVFKQGKAKEVKIEEFSLAYPKLISKEITAVEVNFQQLEAIPVENVKINFVPLHQYFLADMLFAGTGLTNSLNEQQKAILMEAFCKTLPYGDNLRLKSEKDILDALSSKGVNVSEQAYPTFRKASDEIIYGDITKKGWNQEMYESFRGIGR